MCAPFSNFDINEVPIESHQKTWKNLRGTLLSERSQAERATYCKIPTTWHARKGKTTAIVSRSGLGGGGRKDEAAEHGGFLVQRKHPVWYHNDDTCHYKCVQIHRVNANVNYTLVMTRYQCGFINDSKRTALVWRADTGGGCGSRGSVGHLYTFCSVLQWT